MKRLLTILGLLLIGLTKVHASHMMGGDIAYECISPGKYKFVIKIYRDCRGIPFNNPSIGMFCKDGSNYINVNYTRTAINDITEVCDQDPKPCNPTNTPISGVGIEEHVFEAFVDFNASPYKALKDAGCCEIMIKVEQNARNTALTTLVAGTFYTDAMINICLIGDKCNTSPQLSTPPVAVICCNKPFIFNNGVIEIIDGDSLAYSLVNPLKGNNTNETYNGNFTPTIPMTPFCAGNPGQLNCRPIPNAKPPRGFYFDKETGDIIFTPTKCDEAGVIVIKIDEWRWNKDSKKWELIGYTKRDMQLIVELCGDNNPPYFEGKNKYPVCEGEKICFNVVTKDDPFLPNQTVPDTLQLTWNFGIPEGTFRIVDPTAREKTAEFCWETKIGDARPNPYTFTATVKDNNCDDPALANRGYNITVKPKARSIRSYNIGNCGWLQFGAIPADSINQNPKNYLYKFTIRDSSNSGVPYYTTFSQKDSFKFKRGGKYIIEHFVNNSRYNCPTIYTDTVVIPPVLDVELAFGKDTFVCEGLDLSLEPIVENGIPNYSYRWESPLNTFDPKDTLKSFKLIRPSQSTYVLLQLTDKNKCVDRDTIFVKYQPNPVADIGPDQRICTYQYATLDAQHADTMRYYWLPYGDSTRTLQVNIQGKYIVKVIDSLGCNSSDTLELFVNDTVVANAGPDRTICIQDTLKVLAGNRPNKYLMAGQWRDLNTGGQVSSDSSLKVKIKSGDKRQYSYTLNVTQSGLTCQDIDTFQLDVNLLPTFKFTPIPPRCYADGAINLTLNKFATGISGDGKTTENNIRYYQKNKQPSWITGGPVNVNSYIYDFPKFISNNKIPSKGLTDTICFEYKDSNLCYNSLCKPIQLYGNPEVELKTGTFCQKAGPVRLDKLIAKTGVKAGSIETFRCLSAPSGSGLDPEWLVSKDYSVYPPVDILDIGLEGENEKTGQYEIEYCFKNSITGCKTCDSIKISVVRIPEIQFENIPRLCINNPSLVLDSFARDRNTGMRFLESNWQTVEYGQSRDMSNPVVANRINNSIEDGKRFIPSSGAGQYLVKITDSSSGCAVTDSVEVIVNGLPTIKLNLPDTVCASSQALELSTVQPGGKAGKWSGPGVTDRSFNPDISQRLKQYETGYRLHYEYTHPLTGCTARDSHDILIQTPPVITMKSPNPYKQCEGQAFDLIAEMKWAKSSTWSGNGDGSFLDSTQLNTKYIHGTADTAIDKMNGAVRLMLTSDKEGVCPSTSIPVDLIIEPYPQFHFIANPEIQCEPAIVDFEAFVSKPFNSPKLHYSWWFGNGDSLSGAQASRPRDIRYDTANRNWYDVSLIVSNRWGTAYGQACSIRKDAIDLIKVLPQPKVGFNSDPEFFTTVAFPKFNFRNNTFIRWTDHGSFDYLWNFDNNNPDDTSSETHPTHVYNMDTAIYNVHLQATYTYIFNNEEYVCMDSMTQSRKIGPDVTVFVPNAFSPEQTGPHKNNVFHPVVNGEKTYHVELYNRWGELLWESDDKFASWDGIYKGEPAQQDVYAWIIKVTAYDGSKYIYEGTVTLLR